MKASCTMEKKYCFIVLNESEPNQKTTYTIWLSDELGLSIQESIKKVAPICEFAQLLTYPGLAYEALKQWCYDRQNASLGFVRTREVSEFYSRAFLYEFKNCVDLYSAETNKLAKSAVYQSNKASYNVDGTPYKIIVELRNHVQHTGKIIACTTWDEEKMCLRPTVKLQLFDANEQHRFRGIDLNAPLDLLYLGEKACDSLVKMYKYVIDDRLRENDAFRDVLFLANTLKDVLKDQNLSDDVIPHIHFGSCKDYTYDIQTIDWNALLG